MSVTILPASRRPSSPIAAAVAILLSTAIAAQEPRVPLPAPQPAASTAPAVAGELPPLRVVTEQLGAPPASDTPDFAPMREVESEDGLHTRLVLAGNPYVLSFAAGDYTPEPGIDPDLLELQRRQPNEKAHVYVMIQGRMADAKLRGIEALGADVLDVHTWQSAIVRLPVTRLQALAGLPYVRWVGYPRKFQKLGVRLTRALKAATDAGSTTPLQVYVNLYASDLGPAARWRDIGEPSVTEDGRGISMPATSVMPNGPVQRLLEQLGFVPEFYDQSVFTFRGAATPAQIEAMVALDVVRSVELPIPMSLADDEAMAMIGQDRVRASWPGTGVSIGIIDSGIDSTPWHQDFSGKGFLGWRSDASLPSAFEDGNSHGTHVAGTVFGRGIADKRYMGAAPLVGNGGDGNRIFIGRYLDDNGNGKGDPKGLYDVFKVSQPSNGKSNPKPSVVNNSWGGMDPNGFNGTEYESRTVDETVYENDQTYVFAAGNKKSVANWWAGAPGCAKNVLTVGATTDRWDGTNRPGAAASFTRRSTTDGRYKPEICAPGDIHTSTANNSSTGYSNKSGTSMASPTVTGAAASLIDRDGNFTYSPAAVKAAMVASATNDGTLSYETIRGFGQIDAYKLNRAGKTTMQLFRGTLTRSGNWAQSDIPITANLRAVRITLVMIEPNASSIASQARRNDLRLWIDTPPYTAGGNTGEFSKSSSNQTVISHSSYIGSAGGLAQLVQGKTIRVKVYAESIKLLDDVKYAVSVIQYYKDPIPATAPTLTVNKSLPAVRPNQNMVLDAILQAHATADDLRNARIWMEGPGGFLMPNMTRTTADGIVHDYTSTNLHPSFPFPYVGFGTDRGMVVGSGPTRNLKFDLVTANPGAHALTVKATYDAGGAAQTLTQAVTMCVDGQAPNAAQLLKSSTHTLSEWSNQPQITFTWIKVSDNGCAGIDRQYHELGTGSVKVPISTSPSVAAPQGWAQVTATSSASGRYFAVRGQDRAGWWGPVASVGPYYIDTVAPVLTQVVINDGATYTDSLLVRIKLPFSDAHSGVGDIRYSLNNTNWSVWETHSSQGQWVFLANAAIGGSSAPGKHRIYAQVRDKAGNVSATKSAEIEYYKKPALTSATIDTLESVSDDYYRLVGTDLDTVQSITFGTRTVTTPWSATHDSYWVNGSFRTFGSTVIWFYPPQGLPPGNYTVKVNGLSGESNTLPLILTANKAPVLRSGKIHLQNSTQTLVVARGTSLPADVKAVILASPSNVPSVLPGIFSFGLGNQFTAYLMFPGLTFAPFSQQTRLSFPVPPILVGQRIYFQAGFLATTTKQVFPVPVTDVWSTSYIR